MNLLVTGGAGYLGSILVEQLLGAGHAVTVLDDFRYGQCSLAHLCRYDRLTIMRGDAADLPSLALFDAVVPLAAVVGEPACRAQFHEASRVNVGAVGRLCDRLGPSQICVIPTTNSGYGMGGAAECTEASPLNPVSHYGRTKVAAEHHVMQRENSVSLRLATAFGMSPRMRLDLLVNDFVHRAVTDKFVVLFEGHFRRNYVHVRDVAAAFLHVLDNFDRMKGQVYNVGLSSANMSKVQLCHKIRKHIPEFTYFEAAVGEDPDKRDYVVSNAKIEATGWKAVRDLDWGIEELIKGYEMVRNNKYGNV